MKTHRLIALVMCSLLGSCVQKTVPEKIGTLPEALPGDKTCAETSALDRLNCVSGERFGKDLDRVVGARPSGTAQWAAVKELCAKRFTDLGYTVEEHNYGTGTNIVGTKLGAELPDERMILSAHYDSVPNCAGADDNGSGVAGVLEAARVLAGGTHRRTLIVACWDEEERGLVGSRAYAKRSKERAEKINVAFSLEMIGYRSTAVDSQAVPAGFELLFPAQVASIRANENRGDFIAVVGDTSAQTAMDRLKDAAVLASLPAQILPLAPAMIPLAPDLSRSDHASFWEIGVPALMLTDTANFRNHAYHCRQGEDARATLDTDFATKVVALTAHAVTQLLNSN